MIAILWSINKESKQTPGKKVVFCKKIKDKQKKKQPTYIWYLKQTTLQKSSGYYEITYNSENRTYCCEEAPN